MADVPVAEGGRPGGGGGGLGNHWLAIGAIAGVGTLMILLLKGSGGSSGGTTAAGTSINAALGSIQEQQLNMMGQMGAGFNLLSTQMTDFQDSTLAQMTGMQDSLTSQMTGLDTHLSDINSGLVAELGAVNDGVIANGQGIAGLGTQLTQMFAALQHAETQTQEQYTNLQNQIAQQGSAATEQQKASLAAMQSYFGTLSAKSDYVVAMLSTWFPALSGQIEASSPYHVGLH